MNEPWGEPKPASTHVNRSIVFWLQWEQDEVLHGQPRRDYSNDVMVLVTACSALIQFFCEHASWHSL